MHYFGKSMRDTGAHAMGVPSRHGDPREDNEEPILRVPECTYLGMPVGGEVEDLAATGMECKKYD